MMPYYVYVYRDAKGNPFYVGKGKGNRYRHHLHACHNTHRRSYRTMFYCKLRKMEHNREVVDIEIFKDYLSESEAFEWERFLVAFWGRRDIGAGLLCNHTDGGEGQSGYRHSEESRQKMREVQTPRLRKLAKAQRGKKLSVETRAKISEANKKWKRRPDSIKKTAAAHRGMKRSAETCRRISDSKSNPSKETCRKISKARKISVMALDIVTLEDLVSFDSCLDASRFLGVSSAAINYALRNPLKTSAGCKWRYIV